MRENTKNKTLSPDCVETTAKRYASAKRVDRKADKWSYPVSVDGGGLAVNPSDEWLLSSRLDLSAKAGNGQVTCIPAWRRSLAQRVEAVADRANRRPHASLAAAHPEGDRGLLCALVGMMDHPGGPLLP